MFRQHFNRVGKLLRLQGPFLHTQSHSYNISTKVDTLYSNHISCTHYILRSTYYTSTSYFHQKPHRLLQLRLDVAHLIKVIVAFAVIVNILFPFEFYINA